MIIQESQNLKYLVSSKSIGFNNNFFLIHSKFIDNRICNKYSPKKGISEINSLDLFKHNVTPEKIFTGNKVLVVSNNYPSYKEKYRNGFLHSRVVKYRELDLDVDVFILKQGAETTFREYEGTNVIEGSKQAGVFPVISLIISSNL